MLVLIFITLLLNFILFSQFKRRSYEDKNFTEKIKVPVWVYLIYFVLAIIPVIGIIAFGFWIWLFIQFLKDADVYYKPGWFIKLLSKEL